MCFSTEAILTPPGMYGAAVTTVVTSNTYGSLWTFINSSCISSKVVVLWCDLWCEEAAWAECSGSFMLHRCCVHVCCFSSAVSPAGDPLTDQTLVFLTYCIITRHITHTLLRWFLCTFLHVLCNHTAVKSGREEGNLPGVSFRLRSCL